MSIRKAESRPTSIWLGAVCFVAGLVMLLLEFQWHFATRRLGQVGYVILISSATISSIWGLKELIAGIWPSVGARGFRFRMLRQGIAYLVIMCILFAGSMTGQSNPLLMVFSTMAGPFIMNGWFTYTMLRGVRVRRVLPERMMAGEVFSVTLELFNKKSWLSLWLMTVRDRVVHKGRTLAPTVLFVRVPPKSERRGQYQLQLLERGRYRFGAVDVSTRFPLGMIERGVGRDISQELLVSPRVGRLHSEWRRRLPQAPELVSQFRTQRGAYHDEMHRLREYRLGDDPRMIHWRTSARMNDLMVCEYHESRDRELLVIFDAFLPGPEGADRQLVERGLQFVASVCLDHLVGRQSLLSVFLVGQELFSWSGDSVDRQADDLLDAMAVLEPTLEKGCERVVGCLSADVTRYQRILVVSTRPSLLNRELHQALNGGVEFQLVGTSEAELAPLFVPDVPEMDASSTDLDADRDAGAVGPGPVRPLEAVRKS